ncbi:MAG TPA: hypothetical protein VFJ09_00115 [Nocardioidaceae bacterium]|nr:hypothetical protein [Nocardioidaceae bacterium]
MAAGVVLEVVAVGLGVRRGELVSFDCGRSARTPLVWAGTSVVPAGSVRERAVLVEGDGEELGVSRTVATCWRSTGRCGGPTISPET